MSNIKVTIEKDGKTVVYSGEFVVIGTVRDDGDDRVVTVATSGGTTAYCAAMLGCQVSAKLVKPFDTMERIRAGEEVM